MKVTIAMANNLIFTSSYVVVNQIVLLHSKTSVRIRAKRPALVVRSGGRKGDPTTVAFQDEIPDCRRRRKTLRRESAGRRRRRRRRTGRLAGR